MRSLFLPSHVGLGHVARDEAIARSLKKLIPYLRIEWCSAEPSLTHLRLWNEKVLPCSKKLTSFSKAIEGVFNEHGYNLRMLGKYLSILKNNFKLLQDYINLSNYDMVFADEFWEFMLSASQEIKDKVVFASDLVFMPYGDGLISYLISLILNKYFKQSFLKFRHRIYMNTLCEAPKGKWYLVLGENVRKWISRNMFIAGLCTSYLPGELPSVKLARKALKVSEGEYLIVSSVGGTSARGEIILHKVFKAVRRVRDDSKVKIKLAIVSGPRIKLSFKEILPEWVISYSTLKSLSTLYMAGDLFIVRPGRTTTADLECLPRSFRGILVPIKNHLEHEHIAKEAAARFPNLFRVVGEGLSVQELAKAIENELNNLKPGFRKPPKDCEGTLRVSKYLRDFLKGSLSK